MFLDDLEKELPLFLILREDGAVALNQSHAPFGKIVDNLEGLGSAAGELVVLAFRPLGRVHLKEFRRAKGVHEKLGA